MAANEHERRNVADRLLLRYARKSPNEIEELTGIPALEAKARIDEILSARDHLTLRQEEVLILEEMAELIHESRDRMQNATDRDYATIANVALRGMTTALSRIEAAKKAVKIDVSKITEGQARVFTRIFDVGYKTILNELANKYEIPAEVVLDLHRMAMDEAQAYANDHTLEED